MDTREYFNGVCTFRITQSHNGAIILCLTNGQDKVETTLNLNQIMELQIPVAMMEGFDQANFASNYNLFN